jgi:hypothetical protein
MNLSPSNEQNISKSEAKNVSWFFVMLGIVVIIVLTMVYKAIFPIGYFRSQELEESRAKWESQQIAHYRMSVDGYGYINVLAVDIEVKDGVVVKIVDNRSKKGLPSSVGVDTSYPYEQLFTIPRQFDYVYESYLKKPASMRVEYDPIFGYPTTIHINPYTEPCCQDFTFEISNFEILP